MDMVVRAESDADWRAVAFEGSLKTYLPLVASNLLLTIVTLGVYRFWAKARSRRYLWSHTRLIDDRLEWSGTGKEMFVGFLLVALCLAPLVLIVALGLPAIAARFGPTASSLVVAVLTPLTLAFVGFARFRALRYRLSRSWWHGIRGGSDDPGRRYALRAILYNGASYFTALIAYPWAQTRLWNERWNAMSFGPSPFQSHLAARQTFGPWLIFWPAFLVTSSVLAIFADDNVIVLGPGAPALAIPLLLYAGLGIAYCAYLATFYAAALDTLKWQEVDFAFEAETNDWLLFYLRSAGLALVTLGLALLIYDYRKWKFMVEHLRIYGDIDLAALEQSRTADTRDAEGLAEAFDLGAF